MIRFQPSFAAARPLSRGCAAEALTLEEFAAAEQLPRGDHSGSQENPALKARREAELALWNAGHVASERAA